LQLYHPAVAAVSCEHCKAWIYDKDWKRAQRGGRDAPRPPGTKTPCGICPKKSPEHAKLLKLTRRNELLVRRYRQVQATAGACLSDAERADGWLASLLAIVDREFKEFEAHRQLRNTIDLLTLGKR
jgi:hypothetical protein